MEKELISVIIPVYNVKKYLDKAVISVLQQTYSNIEIILVDDGSTDGSGQICDSYKEKDERIIVIHKENGGLSSARNAGIEVAKGEYLTFLDSDDYISEMMFEKMHSLLINNQADCVQGVVKKVYEGGQNKGKVENEEAIEKIYETKRALESMLYRKDITSYACGKLYKKELFEEIRFPIGKLFEDLATVYKILAKCERVLYTNEIFYYYVQRNNSIVNSSFSKAMYDWVEFCLEIDEFVIENYPEIRAASISKLFMSTADLYRRVPHVSGNKEMLYELSSIIRKHRKAVLWDKNGKTDVRLLAFVSCANIKLLRFLGKIYAGLRSLGLG